jgi:hypothetical protein
MKKNITSWKFIVSIFLGLFGMGSCEDDSYLIDKGISNPYYDGTVWDYLNSRPDYFEKLVDVIEWADMEGVFKDSTITFFAPTDWSINNSLNRLNYYWYNYEGKDSITDIRQVNPEVWRDILSLYIIKDKYLLKDIPQIDTTAMSAYPGQAYVSYNGRPMNIGVVYANAGDVKYVGYRQLIYSYVYDFADNDMKNAYIATSDLQPTNGAIHVIRFTNHTFGFNTRDFITKAITSGISELPLSSTKNNH